MFTSIVLLPSLFRSKKESSSPSLSLSNQICIGKQTLYMEIDSLPCQTKLLRGQLGNIVRVFVNPRQDKLANLLPSGVSWRSHRFRFLLLSRYAGSHEDIVKVMLTLVKVTIGIVKCSCFHGLSFLSRLIMELVKSMFAIAKPSLGTPLSQSRFRGPGAQHRRQLRAPLLFQFRNPFGAQRPTIYDASAFAVEKFHGQ